jgi:hypothetical protein
MVDVTKLLDIKPDDIAACLDTSVKSKGRKIIDPMAMTPSAINACMNGLPESMKGKIVGVVKDKEPIKDSQSPEEVRKANLRALKAKRRDLVASLVDLDIEIFKAEDVEYNSNLAPGAIRAHIIAALEGTWHQLQRQSFTLAEMRELFPHDGITFATWVSELQDMHRERKLFFSGENIIITGMVPK